MRREMGRWFALFGIAVLLSGMLAVGAETFPPLEPAETRPPEESERVSLETEIREEPGGFMVKGGRLIRYSGSGGDVVIPEGINAIGVEVFAEREDIFSVVIPKGMRVICRSAFHSCRNLKTVVLPEGMETIEDHAFADCQSLESIVIPEGVRSIGAAVFNGCESLAEISVPGTLERVGVVAFRNTPWLEAQGDFAVVNGILAVYQGNGGEVMVPDGVRHINFSVFERREDVTGITLPEGVVSIGSWAFSNSGLTHVELPQSLESIGANAFCSCRGLTSIVIPDGITRIESEAFFGCAGLTIYGKPGTVAEECARRHYLPFVPLDA